MVEKHQWKLDWRCTLEDLDHVLRYNLDLEIFQCSGAANFDSRVVETAPTAISIWWRHLISISAQTLPTSTPKIGIWVGLCSTNSSTVHVTDHAQFLTRTSPNGSVRSRLSDSRLVDPHSGRLRGVLEHSRPEHVTRPSCWILLFFQYFWRVAGEHGRREIIESRSAPVVFDLLSQVFIGPGS
jgi:hypothetical protein